MKVRPEVGCPMQMWRERLARQKAQAEAEELGQRLSSQQAGAAASGSANAVAAGLAAGPASDELDEQLMKSLEEEAVRTDHVRDELRRSRVSWGRPPDEAPIWVQLLAMHGRMAAWPCSQGGASLLPFRPTATTLRHLSSCSLALCPSQSLPHRPFFSPYFQAHQLRLGKRAEQLELQLAEYTSLLTAAEGVHQVPCLGGSLPSSPSVHGAAARSPFGRCGSPVRGAIIAVQGRKAVEEASSLRKQLRAAQREAVRLRR